MNESRIEGAGLRMRPHSVHMDDRRLMSISGVRDVISFNEQDILLLTETGELHIEGEQLHITKLNLDDGGVVLEGEIAALEYSEPSERGSLLGRLFR